MTIPIIDFHCDVLFKMNCQYKPFHTGTHYDASLQHLQTGNVKVQAFAIFVWPTLPKAEQLKSALHQYYYFKHHIATAQNKIVHITQWEQLDKLAQDEIGAILTIEGVGFFEGDIKLWHIFKEFGVLNIGLTWNYANEAADGADEDQGRGLTNFGREIIELNNENRVFTDVSHLTEKAFWDVLQVAKYPIASHSNAKAICPHVRNLTDEQIVAMIERNAPIHVVYFPLFLKAEGSAEIADVIKHIDHICALGGKHVIGLGSDFDGIDLKVTGLESAAQSQNLINELLKYYTEDDVKGFAYRNFLINRPK